MLAEVEEACQSEKRDLRFVARGWLKGSIRIATDLPPLQNVPDRLDHVIR